MNELSKARSVLAFRLCKVKGKYWRQNNVCTPSSVLQVVVWRFPVPL